MTRQWLSRFRGTRSKSPEGRARHLCLECLEDRAVPATVNVSTIFDVADPADGKRSIREAVAAANNNPGADVIVLQAGAYRISSALAGEDNNVSGDFDISGSVTIRGAGAGRTTINGHEIDRVFDILGTDPSSMKVVFEGISILNGSVTGDGGGIRTGNADLVVRDCVIAANRASVAGGGIAVHSGNLRVIGTAVARNVAGANSGGMKITGDNTLTLVDSTVRRNIATGFGGGITATTAALTNSTLSGNQSGGDGGGILVDIATLTGCTVSGNIAGENGGGVWGATVTLVNSTVSGNIARTGGGGGINVSTATLTNSNVNGNFAGENGGGILAVTATLNGCAVAGNSSSFGGGLYALDTATLTRSTVSGNSTGGGGGGLFATTATLSGCTISGNSAGHGGGIYSFGGDLSSCTVVENNAHYGGGVDHASGTAQVLTVRNTIIALNLVDFTGIGPNVFGAFSSQGHNLIGYNAGAMGFGDGVNGDIVGTSGTPVDPKLGPLANNGGRTKTHALLGGSKAIDRGDNTNLPPTDQRGLARLKDGNGDGVARVDIGAFER